MFCLHAVRRLLAECFKSPRNRPSRTKKNTRHRSVRLKLEPLENRVLLTAVAPFVDPHPSPFDEFGATVLALGNANVVVTAPFDNAGGTEAGAVYLFNQGGTLISTLRGSHPYDMVGSGGLTALSDGAFDYVIKSQYWNGGEGAVTLGDGGAGNGVSGVVSPANSLVGNIAGDYVGSGGVLPLANGNYVVESPDWSSAKAADVGAVTFVSGAAETGQVLAENSLVGSTSGDYVGSGGVVALSPSNNFVVDSPDWTNPDGSNGSAVNAGAVTWVNGTTGTTVDGESVVNDIVNNVNSLVGTTTGCFVGSGGVTVLKASQSVSNYVVVSPDWNNGAYLNAGAVTWVNGGTGETTDGKSVVSSENSLVGITSGSLVGSGGVVPLTAISSSSPNYVVVSPLWNDDGVPDAGAVTWGNGVSGITIGAVSESNSLYGETPYSLIGIGGVVPLSSPSDNYVVDSPECSIGSETDAGAVTLANGNGGSSGPVSATNSVVGSTANSLVGTGGVVALTNGDYVIKSPYWRTDSAADLGAVTEENGATVETPGVVSAANSFVGSTAGDYVGSGGVVALANGNYVVAQPRLEQWCGS